MIKDYGKNERTDKEGVDFYLKFKYGWFRKFRIFIEVQNSDDFVKSKVIIYDNSFNSQILNRYKDYDKLNIIRHRLLLITNGYQDNIKSRCEKHRIKVISFQNQIIP